MLEKHFLGCYGNTNSNNQGGQFMELRVLRYFLAVAREGSVVKAAHFLHVTQPTLSRQLCDLEEELGQKLFDRSTHRMLLTPEGMLLRRRAEEIMEMVHKTEAEFSSIGENIAGDVYIGGGETDAMRLIAQIIREIREDYPDIRFHLHSGNAEDVGDRIDRGILDFGVLLQPANIAKYDYLNLPAQDTWGVIMRRDAPLAEKKSVTLDDILELPLICSRQVAERRLGKLEYPAWFGKKFEKLNVVATYNLIYNAALLVEEGIGYAIGIDKLVNTTRHTNLCFRPLEPRLESGLSIVWKKYQVFSCATEVFFEKIQEKFSG